MHMHVTSTPPPPSHRCTLWCPLRVCALPLLLALGLDLASTDRVNAQDPASIHIRTLEESPRHHEWVEIPADRVDGAAGRRVKAFVVYPEVSEPALSVIVIHENRGLTDWVRSFTDELAGLGVLAIAPDLLSDFDESHRSTRDFDSEDEARTALYALDPKQITLDLSAVERYAASLPASTGNIVLMGFCWGGSQTFTHATVSNRLEAAMVFYGSSPSDSTAYSRITAPVHGFYAENDNRINSQLPATERWAAAAGVRFEPVMYAGAGHAFMRLGAQEGTTPANAAAREAAWERLTVLLDGIGKGVKAHGDE